MIAPYAPLRMGAGPRLDPPLLAHPVGTDDFARDVLSPILLFGARLTLQIGVIAVGISLTCGLLRGLVAGYSSGWTERVLLRLVDVLFSFTVLGQGDGGSGRTALPPRGAGIRPYPPLPACIPGRSAAAAGDRALSVNPKLVVADTPTSALDVSVQAQVLDLRLELQQSLGLAYLFISHDMAVVAEVSHRVAVMRRGRIVGIGPRQAVLNDPHHPYTRALLAAVPVPDPTRTRGALPMIYAASQPMGALDEVAPQHLVAQN